MKRMVSALLAVLLLVMLCLPTAALAAGKKEVTREISVVFDNSSSMYNNTDAWCRATYAVEVFAAMMNDGDTLKVFPMNPVTAQGGTYSMDVPIVVRSSADIAIIHDMYSDEGGYTHIESITAAYQDLMSASADEKWLVVITDGGYFHRNNTSLSATSTVQALTDLLGEYSASCQVQYLAIGNNAARPDLPDSASFRSAVAANSSGIIHMLTQACNEIFGRDTLPASSIRGNTLSFDVTMKKLIVFAQGQGAAVGSLEGPSGPVSEIAGSRYAVTPSEKGGYDSIYDIGERIVDYSLGGEVVTYSATGDGSYTLDYVGSELAVYYEPDVSLQATVVDAEGNVLDGTDPNLTLTAGEYTITYELIDNGTGKPTTSNLLGSVSYDATATVGGSQLQLVSGVPVKLAEGETLEFDIRASYLSGYEERFTSSDYFLHGQNLKPADPEAAGALTMEVTGGVPECCVSDIAAKAVYTVRFAYEGAALSAEEMEALQLTLSAPAGMVGTVEKDPTGSCATVCLAPSGAVSIAPGEHTFTLNGVLPHSDTDDAVADVSASLVVAGDALTAELSVDKDHIVLREMETNEPFVLYITKNGQPVTDEELAVLTANLQVDINGTNVNYQASPVPGGSRIQIALRHAGAQENTETGSCDMTVTTGMKDPSGNAITAGDEIKFTLSVLPLWLKILIVLLILAVIIAIIEAYLSVKVLPNTMTFSDVEFRVRGRVIDVDAEISPSSSKKQGTISIVSPSADAYPEVENFGVSVSLEAFSKRKVKSVRRRATVTAISFNNAGSIKTAAIGSTMFSKDRKTGELIVDGYEPGDVVKYGEISDGSDCSIECVFVNAEGSRSRASLDFRVRFE